MVRLGNRIALECSSWGVSSLWTYITSTPHHPSEFSHSLYLRPMYRRNGKGKGFCQSLSTLPGSPLALHLRGLTAGIYPFQGQNTGNKAGTPALVTNFKSSLCRKKPSAYNTNHFHWFWCSPTLIPRFDLIFNTSFPFSCQAERATLSLGPWSCSPPRWVSPLAAGTAFLPKLLIRSNQNKSQPDRFQSLKLLNWSVCKIIPPIIED